jgi:hypothetical protein
MLRFYSYSPNEENDEWEKIATLLRVLDSSSYQNVFFAWNNELRSQTEAEVHRLCEIILAQLDQGNLKIEFQVKPMTSI